MALGGAILVTAKMRWLHSGAKSALASVRILAPPSEHAGTCTRTSFQYKVVHVSQGDSYKTATCIPQDGPWGTYKNI